MKSNAIGYPFWKEQVAKKPDLEKACMELFNTSAGNVKVEQCDLTEFTDDPTVTPGDPIYFEAGMNKIATDANGNKFLLLDKRSVLPKDWRKVQAAEVIRQHIVNNGLTAGQFLK